MNLKKTELVSILSNYYGKPKSFFNKERKEFLEYLYEEEVFPDIYTSNLQGGVE